MTRYHVNVEYDGRFWSMLVAEVGWSAQARRLHEVEPIARDLVAEMRGVDPATVDLAVHIKIPEKAEGHIRRAEELRAAAADAQAQAAAEVETATRLLQEEGLPMQDIGQVLEGQ